MIYRADIDWDDSGLPLPIVEFNGQSRNTTIMSQDVSMVAERRERFTHAYGQVFVTWQLSPAQFTTFKTYLQDDLSVGTSIFKLYLRYPLNSGISLWAVRILDGYSATYSDQSWSVSMTLDLLWPVLLFPEPDGQYAANDDDAMVVNDDGTYIIP